ncbi:hypothetical protein [Kitasatospora sp. NPDC057936]|uniref:hypothetical protein n=1 Tax=Kitasatospora sp. NPDC057936 TaxID=3346283 RepID=UPI0036DC2C54
MTTDPTTPTRRRPLVRAAVAAAVGAGLLAALAPAASARPAERLSVTADQRTDHAALDAALADLTTKRYTTAALGAVREHGRLLRPAELAAMQQTTARGGGHDYGLGLQRMDTPCGTFWGHSGGIPGYNTMMLGSADGGRQFATSLTPYELTDQAGATAALNALITTGTCGG